MDDIRRKLNVKHSTDWRKGPYGIMEYQGYEHYILVDRDYDFIAELPELKAEDVAKFHSPLAGKFSGSAYLYNDGSSPADFHQYPQKAQVYYALVEQLRTLPMREPVQVSSPEL